MQPTIANQAEVGASDEDAPERELGVTAAFKRLEAKHRPFYERLSVGRSIPYWVFWIVFGQLFFLLHYLAGVSEGVGVLGDFTWLLGVIPGLGMAAVTNRTIRLREPFVELSRLVDMPIEAYEEQWSEALGKWLRDHWFLLSGLAFGLFNVWFGETFGGWYEQPSLQLTQTMLHFVAGFVGGTAIYGALVVGVVTKAIARMPLRLDFEAEDGCGGTSFLGEKLLWDSIVVFVVGILISAYIWLAPWTNIEDELVRALRWGWVALPYVVTVALFFFPARAIHSSMAAIRSERLSEVWAERQRIRAQIEAIGDSRDAVKVRLRGELSAGYEEVMAERERLSSTSSWPVNLKQILELLSTLIIPVLVFFLDFMFG